MFRCQRTRHLLVRLAYQPNLSAIQQYFFSLTQQYLAIDECGLSKTSSILAENRSRINRLHTKSILQWREGRSALKRTEFETRGSHFKWKAWEALNWIHRSQLCPPKGRASSCLTVWGTCGSSVPPCSAFPELRGRSRAAARSLQHRQGTCLLIMLPGFPQFTGLPSYPFTLVLWLLMAKQMGDPLPTGCAQMGDPLPTGSIAKFFRLPVTSNL